MLMIAEKGGIACGRKGALLTNCIVLSGILPVMGGKGEEYRNYRRMLINTQTKNVCMEEGVGFVDK